MLQEVVPKALETVIYGQMEEAKDFWFEHLDCLASHVRHDFSSRRRPKGSNNKIKDVREKLWLWERRAYLHSHKVHVNQLCLSSILEKNVKSQTVYIQIKLVYV